MSLITMRRIAALFAVAAAAMLVAPVAGASAAPFTVDPNPINMRAAPGETAQRAVLVTNNTTTTTDIRLLVLPGGEAFRVAGGLCPHVAPGGRCAMRIAYTATNQPEDHGTLRVEDEHRNFIRIEVPLNGNRSSGGPTDTTPPNCTLAAKRNQKLIVLVRRHRGRRIVVVEQRNRFNVGVTSSEDGTVSALASGRDSKHKAISLKVASAPATAGHGVGLRLRMDSTTEKRILADVRADRTPRMTLRGNCIDKAGNARQVTAVLRFRDAKPGRAFRFPLFADATAR